MHAVVPAFERLLETFPNAVLVLANARGRNAPGIHALLQRLPADRYAEIPFEEDNAAMYGLFDVLVHVPLRPGFEGFGMPYVEALASGTPLESSLRREWGANPGTPAKRVGRGL